LDESGERLAVLPCLVVQEPVDGWRFSDTDSGRDRSFLCQRRSKASAENNQKDDNK
jgi:hypothetical protein